MSSIPEFANYLISFIFYPSPQNPDYHHFADTRSYLGVPNFCDVASSVGFVLVGFWGLYGLLQHEQGMRWPERTPWLVFAVGVLLTGMGSSYYHWHPDNDTLVWDRLPMTMAFMGLFSAVLCECGQARLLWSLPGLVLCGLTSVWYWYYTEQHHAGDLRPYLLVQFLPMVVIPVMVLFRSSCWSHQHELWWVWCAYGLAKIAEAGDAVVYHATSELVSGHTLKHVLATVAVVIVLRMLRRRVRRLPLE